MISIEESIRISKGVLEISKRPGAPFDRVWTITGGFRVQLGMTGEPSILSWSKASKLIDGRDMARIKVLRRHKILFVKTLSPRKRAPQPQERIPEQWEGRRAEYLRRKA
jgi:hypothetical protein